MQPQLISDLASAFANAGGRALLVGGTARDRSLDLPVHDWDIEVFGLPLEQIKSVAQAFGPVHEVGRAFGILKLQASGQEVDLAAPRKEIKTGRGHTGFSVMIDPSLPPEQAARRRDFTVNAIAEDPLTGEVIDPFGGRSDLTKHILRVVDPQTFGEDPLRVLRAVQLAGRFALHADVQSLSLLQTMFPALAELSKDRLRAEWVKLLLLSQKPSLGLALAKSIGLFRDHPFGRLSDIAGRNGSLWTQTLHDVDRAASLVRRVYPNALDRIVVVLAAFCNNVGAAVTTQPSDRGVIGGPIAGTWMQTQGFPQQIQLQVQGLMRGFSTAKPLFERQSAQVPDGEIRRLVNLTHPANPHQLRTLIQASAEQPPMLTQWLWSRLTTLGLKDGPRPVVSGHDLLKLGWSADHRYAQIIGLAERVAEQTGCSRNDILAIIRTASDAQAAIRLLKEKLTA